MPLLPSLLASAPSVLLSPHYPLVNPPSISAAPAAANSAVPADPVAAAHPVPIVLGTPAHWREEADMASVQAADFHAWCAYLDPRDASSHSYNGPTWEARKSIMSILYSSLPLNICAYLYHL
ncbi:hypothetical protein C8F04DRAFT_1279819 [Mycena alexandri]|uniref:Uncharacterized protein n=1 Tax=Mycena alexandri TaxID=1745969 RepID=A0AAD6RXK3_9AGAR|nr:hypothetical protein C8F04DRAFT_1279819 [Mycena alexandri]